MNLQQQRTVSASAILLGLLLSLNSRGATTPIVAENVVFAEQDGIVAVEAEHFYKQTNTDTRAFYLTTSETSADVKPDGDPSHVAGASGGAYLEILPDTRRTHADKLIRGENFSPQPGKLAILHYKVHVQTPGRYYVWVRAHSTGSEDNGLHVGIDGTWPTTGQRLQWCKGKHTWRWESKQRTEKEHCGEPYKLYLDIKQPGTHTIHFSMREDGFEFDKWFMTTQRDFTRPDDTGPRSSIHAGTLPEPFALVEDSSKETQLVFTSQAAAPAQGSPTRPVSAESLISARQPNGDGTVEVSGELKKWHKVTLTLDGPFAHEQDNQPNPFTDYRMSVLFTHEDGGSYLVPGYFAADGDAGNTSAESGTRWRAHFAPDRTGSWAYKVSFSQGSGVALDDDADTQSVEPFDGKSGSFDVAASDKQGRDLRAQGRLAVRWEALPSVRRHRQLFLKGRSRCARDVAWVRGL